MKSGLHKKAQLWLDVGAGDNPQPGCMTMDKRKRDGIDVVHDCEILPWPFAANTFDKIIMSHLVEHLKPWLIIDIFDEMWRVMKPNGQLMIATPYAGSFGFWQDPTHIKPWNEATATYFDSDCQLYQIYKPRPWKIMINSWHSNGNLEVVLSARKEKRDLQ